MNADASADAHPSILVSGEALIDFIPDRHGSLDEVARFDRRAGGATANVAVALAKLDAPPWLCTRTGADPFGDFLARTLADHGVPDRFVQRDPDRKTTLAFVTHDEAADRSFSFYRDDTADVHLDTAAVPDAVLGAVSWLSVGGVMLAADPGRTATFDLVSRARERDCTVVFDPNSRPELWTDGDRGGVTERMIGRADVVKASTDDLRGTRFAADDPADAAGSLVESGPHTALLTRGDAGTVARASADASWGPAAVDSTGYEVDAVDTTGAGDAFLAGVLVALDSGDPLAEAVDVGNAVAALATTGAGGMDPLPDRAAVESLRADGA